MTTYEFGDVILVPFPFTDQTTTKRRPAIVVSSAGYNRQHPDIILMAVTSHLRPTASFGEVPVVLWNQAGLLKRSVIKPVFAIVEKGLVLRRLGRLDQKDRKALQDALKAILGI
jgi:mRNA interferase MazF